MALYAVEIICLSAKATGATCRRPVGSGLIQRTSGASRVDQCWNRKSICEILTLGHFALKFGGVI